MAKYRGPDTTRIKLRGHIHRGVVTGFATTAGDENAKTIATPTRAWLVVGIGVGCLVTGVVPHFAGFGAESGDRVVLWLFSAIFVLGGILGIVVGFQSLQKLRIIEELRARHPNEPWLADFTWDQQGASEDTQKQRKQAFRNGISCFAAVSVIGVMLVAKFGIQNLAKWPREQIVNSSIVVIALTSIVVIGFWQLGKAAYLTARMAKYGQSEISFQQFPFLLGETLEVTLTPGRVIRTASRVVCTLRCVQEDRGALGDRGALFAGQ